MAGFWVRHRRGARELDVDDAESAKRAGLALVAADERLRAAVDELGFAEAELGDDATEPLRDALVATRRILGDAFRLHRLNHDAFPGTADEVRDRSARIVELCDGIDGVLDAQTSALAERIARARRAPEILIAVRADVERLRARLPHARDTLDRLAARYARSALAVVEANPADAAQLLGFAEHSVGVAERRREAGQREHAHLALEASVESVRRAANLLDAVEVFEVEALRAESALGALAEESRHALAIALEEHHSRGVATAIVELQAALAVLPSAGVDTDPLAHLGRLREAKAALDAATAAARERETCPIPPLHYVHDAIGAADRRLDIARDAVAAHPGRIGAEALTRLAEAERTRGDLRHYLGAPAANVSALDDHRREHAMAMADRVAHLASEALNLARRDLAAFRSAGRAAVALTPTARTG